MVRFGKMEEQERRELLASMKEMSLDSNKHIDNAAFQHVRENIDDLDGKNGINETDLIFLKGLMDSPVLTNLVKTAGEIVLRRAYFTACNHWMIQDLITSKSTKKSDTYIGIENDPVRDKRSYTRRNVIEDQAQELENLSLWQSRVESVSYDSCRIIVVREDHNKFGEDRQRFKIVWKTLQYSPSQCPRKARAS
ncbi:uncharacterized protein LOC108909461 [Anoplophora glabripennis]|uniref:uncharacterized protein LOC108909461 n=1 Tax=Anoplophora glabripennis TaxID=217634 RepID=UPI000873B04D|nr:uncharacterized protein LOC108909461 [Anoplophora glabripennis]